MAITLTDAEKEVIKTVMSNAGYALLMEYMVANIPVMKTANAQSITDLITTLGNMATDLQTKIDGLEAAKQAETNRLFIQKAIVLGLKAKLQG